MASTTPALIRASLPLARAAVTVARRPGVRGLAQAAARRLDRGAAEEPLRRHPMMPAAVRVERSRSRGGDSKSGQTAVTMWFGQGPALPGPGGSPLRSALRVGTSIVGAAALAAMTVIAARREESRATIVDAAPRLPLT